MDFRTLFTNKTIRFVGVTILLGAIGSGLWEWMLKPFLMGASDFGLNIATLGMRTFKDSLYKEIAHGFHEESSLRVSMVVFALLPGFILGVLTGVLHARKKAAAGLKTTLYDRVMEKISRPMLVLLVFVLVFSFVQANQHAYINRAVTHFHQLLAIAGPYLSEEERMLYKSRFAQISSSDDYASLTAALEDLCRAKNLRTPTFVVW